MHPRLAQLLGEQGWQGLTSAQEAALQPLLDGKHVLLVAPTGHGKTEAALIPVLSRMLVERDQLAVQKKPWPKGFKVLYVTPLRALNRDLLRRLESWGEALGFDIGVRHGDTSQSERNKQSRNPPDLLITTPETTQLLLYGDKLRQHLATVRFVVLDEVHDMAVSERGAQLLVALERIEEVIGQPQTLRESPAAERPCPENPHARPGGGFQRIGVSATVADPAVVGRWLGGAGRDVKVVTVAAVKDIRLRVEHPDMDGKDEERAQRLALTPNIMAQIRTVRRITREHKRVLIFHNTRDGAELLASRSAMLDDEGVSPATEIPAEPGHGTGRASPAATTMTAPDGPPVRLGLHHGSLSAEVRTEVEEAFKDGRVQALVATSSMELGIDVGAIDHVVQVGSPRSVARLVQRLGRSGHRVGAFSDGTLLATGPEDILECLAVARRAREGRLEHLQIRFDPLVVLANQLVAMTNEYTGLRKTWCRAVMTRAGCFRDLDDGLFDAVWETLLDVKTLYPEGSYAEAGERVPMPPPATVERIARSGRARRHFLDHISLIPDERTYRVIDESSKRAIGTVDDSFVAAAMAPGSLIVMAGRSWRVLEVETEQARVRVAPVKELGPIPQWTGAQLPVSFDVAQEVAKLRRLLAENDAEAAQYPLDAAIRRKALEPIEKHRKEGLVVPTDRRVTLEVNRRVIIANISLGTRGNEALARITQALLSQKLGAPIGVESDAYRIHFMLPIIRPAQDILDIWNGLDARSLDLLMTLVLKDSPLVRHHLVHVAKHFGALPKDLDPNRFGRAKLDALFDHIALQEETLARLIHDRMDVPAVRSFVEVMGRGDVQFTIQAQGPLSHLGQDETRRLLAPPKTDDTILTAVRKRIEDSDALLICVNCRNTWQTKVLLLPRQVKCRRCQSIQVACMRPWNEDKVRLLTADLKSLKRDERNERERMVRNGAIVAAFGNVACRALVARGVGPDTAARILQKVTDPANPGFWREILQAELTFARTNMFWKR